MNKIIGAAISKYEQAAAALKRTLKLEQSKCSHKEVIHSPWRSSQWGSAFKARRLCLQCGLEEEAQHSGWGDNDCDFQRLKTGGFHKVVASEALYKSRFPEADVA